MTDGNAPPSPRLEFREVDVELAGRAVLHRLSFSVAGGEMLAIVGPNGSGKTTLLRSALGLQKTSHGEVRLFGKPVDRLDPRQRALHAAWLPQSEAPADNLSVRDYVSLGRYPHVGSFGAENAEDGDAVERALEEAELTPFSHRGVLHLSGGERQRVLYARALAQGAPLLLLDEPTSHLDVSYQFRMMEQLHRFVRSSRQRAVILSVHDLNLACRYADRILWLAGGRCVALGSPQETITEERIYRVFGIDAGVHREGGQVAVFPRRPPPAILGPTPGSRRVHVICGGGSGEELLQGLVERGHEVTAGTLHLLDSDQVTCERLHIPGPLESPFSAITEGTRAAHREILARSEVIVIAPLMVGPGNLANLEDALPFVTGRPTYFLRGVPGPDRDFTDGKASEVCAELRRKGAVVVRDLAAFYEDLVRPGASSKPLDPEPLGDPETQRDPGAMAEEAK